MPGKRAPLQPFEERPAGRGDVGELVGDAGGIEGGNRIAAARHRGERAGGGRSAAARASLNVPSPNGAISKAPSGPFHSSVRQRLKTSA